MKQSQIGYTAKQRQEQSITPSVTIHADPAHVAQQSQHGASQTVTSQTAFTVAGADDQVLVARQLTPDEVTALCAVMRDEAQGQTAQVLNGPWTSSSEFQLGSDTQAQGGHREIARDAGDAARTMGLTRARRVEQRPADDHIDPTSGPSEQMPQGEATVQPVETDRPAAPTSADAIRDRIVSMGGMPWGIRFPLATTQPADAVEQSPALAEQAPAEGSLGTVLRNDVVIIVRGEATIPPAESEAAVPATQPIEAQIQQISPAPK
jgi:hypothetical protein